MNASLVCKHHCNIHIEKTTLIGVVFLLQQVLNVLVDMVLE